MVGVSLSVLSSVEHYGIDLTVGSNQRLKLLFAVSLLSTQYKGARALTSWLGIRIKCPSGATCLMWTDIL